MFGAAVPCFEARERLLKVALCIVCIGLGGCMVYAVWVLLAIDIAVVG